MALRVTIWNEFHDERHKEDARAVYPDGIHAALAQAFAGDDRFQVATATLDDADQGLSDARLAETDVLFWWAHHRHADVADDLAVRVQQRVLDGMGFVPLHSAHVSKPITRLLGASCQLSWRVAAERERLWVVAPGHSIAEGLGRYVELAEEEAYGEPFDIPAPDELVFVSWFQGGDVFRSGCGYRRGRGRIFYFRPGHETYPTYYVPEVQQILRNAALWAAPTDTAPLEFGRRPPLEPLPGWTD